MTMGASRARPLVVVDVLQGLTISFEAVSLCMEILQLKREGIVYFTGPWNVLDVAASGCLLAAGVFYFGENDLGQMRSVGALGVALKCVGLIDYLRCFPQTASLVRMVSVILGDIVPFMAILSVMLTGASLFFAINSPNNEEFALDDEVVGPFRPLLTVFQLSLGMDVGGCRADSSTLSAVLVMVVFMGIVVVVLLNMLIAIMGDSYEKVKESERVEALRERAQIIVEAELSSRHRHKYHKYMHFVDAAESSEVASFQHWDGITGRVKQLLEVNNDRLKGEIDTVRGELRDVNDQLKGEMDTVREDLRDIKQLLDSVASQLKSK